MKQIIYEIKSQPLIAIVTVIGTSLAIFLIMIAVMLQQVKVMPMAPESARDRMIYVSRGCIVKPDGSVRANSALSYPSANELVTDLKGAEAVAVIGSYVNSALIAAPGKPSFFADYREADNRFFDLFDITFIAGKPFTEADLSSGLKKVVITESVAREAFDKPEDAVGKVVEVNDVPYTVTGVTKDVSPITDNAYAQVWIALNTNVDFSNSWTAMGLGSYMGIVKAESADLFGEISEEINRRAEIISTRLNLDEDMAFTLEGGPKDQETRFTTPGADNSRVEKEKRQQWFLYFILLLIPAINLSSMTRSRLRRRTGEIGVRRAFGCTRSRVIYDILLENFIVTLIGGIIGLLACFIFGSLLFDAIYSAGYWTRFSVPVTLSFSSLLDWSMFAYALLFCFVLNLISTGFPAWRASRVNPVDAINSRIR